MTLLLTLLAFALTLGVLVVFHELGHYVVARMVGVKVLRFSFGFGPVLWKQVWGRDQTEWTFSAFPLGGYVKMLDETESSVDAADSPRAFNQQTVWARMAIVVAGPVANLLLAVLLYWGMFLHGIPAIRPILAEPALATPAALAGLHQHEQIASIGGETIQSWNQLSWELLRHAGDVQPLPFVLTDGKAGWLSVSGVRMDDERQSITDQLGMHLIEPSLAPVIGQLLPDSIAARGGLHIGDRIIQLNGQSVTDWQQVVSVVRTHPNQLLHIEVNRAGAVLSLSMTPAAVQDRGQRIGKLGAGPLIDTQLLNDMLTTEQYNLLPALEHALVKTWQTIVLNVGLVKQLIFGQASWHSLSGPITIADFAGQSARMGGIAFAGFLAVISVSLGVLNLLPVPLLDGGHLMYYIAEIVSGSPVSQRTMEIGQRLGMALLMTLMFFAFYNDITRLLGQ